jgi:hypothetical protein
MKKAKASAKKLNNIKSKTKSPTKVIGKVKALAKGLVKAMAPKAAKKPQTKAPTKLKAPAKVVTKAAKPAPKVDLKAAKKGKPAPVVKAAPKKDLKEVSKKDATKVAPPAIAVKGKKGKDAPAPVAAPAVLTKPGKAPKAGKSGKAMIANAHNEKMCRETGCENPATTKGYCRLDYIKNWKKIKRKEMILKEGKLNQYIEELVSKYPDKYIDVIRQDLSSEVNFNKVIHDLELDESIDDLDYDGDSIDSLIGSIRKEDEGFDDTDF